MNVRYAIGRPGGAVRVILTDTPEGAALNTLAGEVCVEVPTLPAEPVMVADDGKSVVSGTVPLDQLRSAKWRDAKAYRAARMAAGCATALGRVQTDSASIRTIVQFASIAANNQVAVPAWSVAFTMADNTVVQHSAVQMIAMEKAVGDYVAACQSASRAVRAKIDAAATAAQLDAIDVTQGYPD